MTEEQKQQIPAEHPRQIQPQKIPPAQMRHDQLAEDVKSPHVEEDVAEIAVNEPRGQQLEDEPPVRRAAHRQPHRKLRIAHREDKHDHVDRDQAPQIFHLIADVGIPAARHVIPVEKSHFSPSRRK